MRKQELIHLHSLLAEVASYCEETGAALDLKEYHSQDTHPMAISDAKGDHERAVMALVHGLGRSLDEEKDEAVAVSAD